MDGDIFAKGRRKKERIWPEHPRRKQQEGFDMSPPRKKGRKLA